MNKDESKAYNNIALNLYKLGKYEEAIEYLDKAIEVYPTNTSAYYNKGLALYELGKYKAAIECYDKLIKIDHKNSNVFYNNGKALFNLGMPNEAIECYNKALKLNPKDPYIYYDKAIILSDLKKHKEALKCYDKAISMNLNFAEAYNNKGCSLFELGKHEEALKCYNKAIRDDPTDSDFYSNKGEALFHMGKKQEAIEFYDKAIKIDPKNSNAFNEKGKALHNSGKYEEAIECYDKAIEINPNYSAAIENRLKAKEKLNERKNVIRPFSPEYTYLDINKEVEIKEDNTINVQEKENKIQNDEVKLMELLGSGSFSNVFLGEYNFTNVAVKEIEFKEKELYKQIVNEVDMMKNLRHPNLINYYEYSLNNGKIKVIMEYCKGDTVFNLIHKKGKSLTIKQKLKILCDTAAGLYYLHSQQPPFLHRDLNSSNVLLVEEVLDGNSNVTAKIKDYGLSRTILEGLKSKGKISSEYSSLCIAPEVWKGENYGVKSDVYSFGIFMWEVLTQKLPYCDFGYDSMFLGVMVAYNKVRPTINLLPKETPEEIINLMKQCWDDDVNKRPTMKEVAGILKNLLK